ncbi:MAG: hypothetical protein JJU45_01535 [Acidimicrobiia bacterium]|nr:hypothetical protein [Acidimicrobiia bacterium]
MDDEVLSWAEALDFAAVIAVLLAGVHLLSPWLRRKAHARWAVINPLSAGALAAYIFLHMLPAVAESEHEFGLAITGVMLVGFVAYYGVEGYLDHRPNRLFWVKIAISWIYSFLVVYSLPSTLATRPAAALVAFAALALHVVQTNNHLAAQAEEQFDAQGRFALATAPLAAIILDFAMGSPSDAAAAFLSAFVSGILLLGLFRDELGSGGRQLRFGLFLVGVTAYGSLLLLEHVLG